jgi:hypothetical protein
LGLLDVDLDHHQQGRERWTDNRCNLFVKLPLKDLAEQSTKMAPILLGISASLGHRLGGAGQRMLPRWSTPADESSGKHLKATRRNRDGGIGIGGISKEMTTGGANTDLVFTKLRSYNVKVRGVHLDIPL